jgi:hypothetical protein
MIKEIRFGIGMIFVILTSPCVIIGIFAKFIMTWIEIGYHLFDKD